MHSIILKNWNNTVKKNDLVFHLGDVSFGDLEQTQQIISKLNGKKILIRGNHDKRRNDEWFRKCGFSKVIEFPIIYKEFYILSHKPVYMNCSIPYRNICAHVHTKPLNQQLFFNVGTMVNNYTPVNFEDIKNHFNNYQTSICSSNLPILNNIY